MHQLEELHQRRDAPAIVVVVLRLVRLHLPLGLLKCGADMLLAKHLQEDDEDLLDRVADFAAVRAREAEEGLDPLQAVPVRLEELQRRVEREEQL